MKTLRISRLYSGGIITNYYCSSKCKHCLYGSSPSWEKKYMDEAMAVRILRKIKALGCHTVHVGGGEPMLNIPCLKKFINTANSEGIGIEYIETNSSWYKDEKSCIELLQELKSIGIHTLLISISPFHNEYIPFYKVKGVMSACRKAGVSIFPWVREFAPQLDALDDQIPHSLEEYKGVFGEDYMLQITSKYNLNYRGRAMLTYKDIYLHQRLEHILEKSKGCDELSGVSHFHFDLFGNYVPGLCSGFGINVDDLGGDIDCHKYPFINLLYSEGIKGFLKMAQEEYGFEPRETYLSKCHLCFDIRSYLVREKRIDTAELKPTEHYEHI